MTELHALKPVRTAFEKTRKLLLEPSDAGNWIKLIIITFFVGTGITSFNPWSNLQYRFDLSELDNLPAFDFGQALSDSAIIALVLLVIAAAIAFSLIMSYLRGVFSFVLIEALTTGNVRILRPFKENMGRGFKVFLFNILVAIISLIVIGAIVVAMLLAILGAFGGSSAPDAFSTAGLLLIIAALLVGLLAMAGFSILINLFVGFFYDFGVPLMYFRNMGLRQSIGHVWDLVKSRPFEFLAYILVRWVLEIAVAIITGILFLFILAIFIAAGIFTLIAMLEAAKSGLLFALPFALAIFAGILLMIIVSAVISMPIQVYLRYYSLDFLKSFDQSYVNYTGRMA